ncbi:unnamed protein product, partial [Mesorhabditis spiculigera]
MHSFLILAVLVVAVSTFTQLPSTYTTKQKKDACADYCNGQATSLSTGFAFQSSGWELCNCAPAQATGSWSASSCYSSCYSRCQSTLGLCAWNYATNTDYHGLCCTNSNTTTSVWNTCFKNGTGLCYQA